jgi:magnesium and cobalt exporter, CNNM family
MIEVLQVLGVLVCVAGSFVFAGAETGIYSLSRRQVEVDADGGVRSAAWVRWLLRDESALLITLLIGNNLVLELASRLGDELVHGAGLSSAWTAAAVILGLAPVVFLMGEALPKDLFRRRPQALTYGVAPVVVLARVVFWPLERALRVLSALLERSFGLGSGRVSAIPARERLTTLLDEGQRQGVLAERARVLAENALKLRSIPVATCMTAWDSVLVLRSDAGDGAHRRCLASSRWTRLPVVGGAGEFLGYVHQLEVLAAGDGQPVLGHQRPLPVIPVDTPVDRALLRLRGSGKRAAVVGTAAAPVGLVTLKDLVEEISGDLAGI